MLASSLEPGAPRKSSHPHRLPCPGPWREWPPPRRGSLCPSPPASLSPPNPLPQALPRLQPPPGADPGQPVPLCGAGRGLGLLQPHSLLRTPCHRSSPDSSLDTRCLLGPSPLPARTLVYPPAASARHPWEVGAGWRAGREGREPARGAGLWVGAAVTQLGASIRGLPTPRLLAGICSEGSAWPPSR